MNQKGLTLVELITTFALAAVIILILTNVIVIIKNIYSNNNIKSDLLIEQSNLSKLINQKITTGTLTSYEKCDDSEFCYNFYFIDGGTSKLIVTDDYIRFDNYVYKINNDTVIGNAKIKTETIEVSSTDINNSFLIIDIPLENKLFSDENFGINIVYQYNSNKITLEK